ALLVGDVCRGADDSDDVVGEITYGFDCFAEMSSRAAQRQRHFLAHAFTAESAPLDIRDSCRLLRRIRLIRRLTYQKIDFVDSERVVVPGVAERFVVLEDDGLRRSDGDAESRLRSTQVAKQACVLDELAGVECQLRGKGRMVSPVAA